MTPCPLAAPPPEKTRGRLTTMTAAGSIVDHRVEGCFVAYKDIAGGPPHSIKPFEISPTTVYARGFNASTFAFNSFVRSLMSPSTCIGTPIKIVTPRR